MTTPVYRRGKASIFSPSDEPLPKLSPIRVNIFSTAATIAQTRANKGGEHSDFWQRLAGSLRKAAELHGGKL